MTIQTRKLRKRYLGVRRTCSGGLPFGDSPLLSISSFEVCDTRAEDTSKLDEGAGVPSGVAVHLKCPQNKSERFERFACRPKRH